MDWVTCRVVTYVLIKARAKKCAVHYTDRPRDLQIYYKNNKNTAYNIFSDGIPANTLFVILFIKLNDRSLKIGKKEEYKFQLE